MSDKTGALISKAKHGDMQAFSRLLTVIEREGSAVLGEEDLLESKSCALRVGITGPPGAGKSTFIGEMLKFFTEKNMKIGVIAVDPTSPISQGAILGDRIRYAEHALHENVFIRSIGTRGSLGGLSSSVYLMVRAFDACGFDLVLIETVGVGQVEVEVMNVADLVCVMLVPESGDSIQAMKAGIIEIADLFIVNKSDRPGAEVLKRELEAAIAMSENQNKNLHVNHVEIFLTSAVRGEGVKSVVDYIDQYRSQLSANELKKSRLSPERLREEAKALMRTQIENEAAKRVSGVHSPTDLLNLFKKTELSKN